MIRWRLLVAEAALLLLAARLLVASLRLGHWRRCLGSVATAATTGIATDSDRLLAKAVDRATLRLPGQSKCLPRAMALHWMLARRGQGAQLVIAVLPGAARGGLDDLHAWVEAGEEILIGQLDQPFRPLARFGFRDSSQNR
jgi:hypothetical protein